jgi:hypothetical protein
LKWFIKAQFTLNDCFFEPSETSLNKIQTLEPFSRSRNKVPIYQVNHQFNVIAVATNELFYEKEIQVLI